MEKTTSPKMKLFVVMQLQNGWDYAPCEKTSIFTTKSEANTLFKEWVKDAKEDEMEECKIYLAQVEPGKKFGFVGYGEFEGGTLIKEWNP